MLKSLLMVAAAAATGFSVVYGASDLNGPPPLRKTVEAPPVVVEFIINPSAEAAPAASDNLELAEGTEPSEPVAPAGPSVDAVEQQVSSANEPAVLTPPKTTGVVQLSPSVLLIF